MTEIPIGYVGVVVSYVGDEHVDVSGDTFTHGDLVQRGRKGVWSELLLPWQASDQHLGHEGGVGADTPQTLSSTGPSAPRPTTTTNV